MFVAFKSAARLSKYAHVPTRISQLRVAKSKLSKQYWAMYDDFVTYKKDIDKSIFNKIVQEIREIETEIDRLVEILRPTDHTIDIDNNHTQEAVTAKAFIAKRSEVKEDVSDWKSYWVPVEHDDKVETQVQVLKESTPPKKKPRVKNKLSKETTQVITSNIKELLSDFAFKTKTECVSKQRTKPYYASKEEILEKIESNPELKKLMPTNYKKLTKDKLCEVFFATNSNGGN